MGQVYLNPFNSYFRVSLGVVILTIFILAFKNLDIIYVSLLTSFSVVSFRSLLDFIFTNKSFEKILLTHLPSISFYIVFGVTLYLLDIKKYKNKPIILFVILSASDILSNLTETIIRYEFNQVSINKVIYSLFITGVIRGLLSLTAYTSFKFYNFLTIKEEQNKHYKELLLFTTNIKTEMFLLKKSKDNIESTMEKAYFMYSDIKDETNVIKKEKILDIAKDIHEIKKDYQRVICGIENTISFIEDLKYMKLSQIFEIIHDNTTKYIHSLNKSITINFKIKDDIDVKYYYELISILNNLINNSIDAIKENGIISVSQYEDDTKIIFLIEDNGTGIKKEDINFVFNPGFTTKYDFNTGKMSTGIGLTHVKNIVEDILGGSIILDSTHNLGTRFTIYINSNILKGSE